VPLRSPTNLQTNSVHRLTHEIRDTSPNLSQPSTTTNSSSRPASLPARAPPLVTPSTGPPAPLPPHPILFYPHSIAQLPPRPAITPFAPLPVRGTLPGASEMDLRSTFIGKGFATDLTISFFVSVHLFPSSLFLSFVLLFPCRW